MSGCLEHTSVLMAALRDAKRKNRTIIITWLDLANAYGSVRHNLIHFALSWFHVPEWVCVLIKSYYNSLFAKVVTRDWETAIFAFHIGVLQGCTIAPTLFTIVFQLCVTYVEDNGFDPYAFSHDNFDVTSQFGFVQLLQQAYADAHTLITRSIEGAQRSLDLVSLWLEWTSCMRAKPRKCKSLGLSRTNVSFRDADADEKTFSAFNPHLTISGCAIVFLANDPFKCLGRVLFSDLSDSNQRSLLLQQITNDMTKVDAIPLKGIAKTWIYNNYVMAFITWPFIIYEFPPSFVNKITAIVKRYLKRWLHLHKTASPELLFLVCPGLGVKNPTTSLKSLQIVKHLILSKSDDPRTRFVANANHAKAKAATDKRWKPEIEAEEIEREIRWEEKYMPKKHNTTHTKSSKDSQPFSACSHKTQRQIITKRFKQKEAEAMRVRLVDLCRGGNFVAWDRIMDHDISWKEMVFDLSEHVLSFRLNAIAMTLPSWSNLNRWGIKRGGKCPLCLTPNATAGHVSNNCVIALRQGRYTWRHDNVLASIATNLYGLVNRANRHNSQTPTPTSIAFVKSGSHKKHTHHLRSLLTKSPVTDWKINIDFDSVPTIPAISGVDTLLRPDGVIYSNQHKIIIWGELTVPLERNMLDAQLRKTARYGRLKTDLKLAGWKVYDHTWEIGSLGFISRTSDSFLRAIGFSNSQRKHMRKRISTFALRSTYYIWMARHNSKFQPPTLIQRPTPPIIRSYPPPRPVTSRCKRNTALSFLSSLPPIPKPLPAPPPVPGGLSDISDLSSGDISAVLKELPQPSHSERKHPQTDTTPPTHQQQSPLAGFDSFDMDDILTNEDDVMMEMDMLESKHSHLPEPTSPTIPIHHIVPMPTAELPRDDDYEETLADGMGAWDEWN